jgi:hypothetical protein
LQRGEPAVAVGDQTARQVRVGVADLDAHAGEHSTSAIGNDTLDGSRRDLRSGWGRRDHQ